MLTPDTQYSPQQVLTSTHISTHNSSSQSTMLTPSWPLLLLIYTVSADQKVWQWSNDFSNPSHWMEGRSPCPGQDVRIPAEIVFMPHVMVMGRIDLAEG